MGDSEIAVTTQKPKGARVRQPRAVRTRNEIVATAIRLWADHDFDDVTIDAIVQGAGVSKGTFFYHFSRKEDLLVELGWATVDRVGLEAEAEYRAHRSLFAALAAGLAGLARRVDAMPRGAVARTIQEFTFGRYEQTKSDGGRIGFFSGLLHAAQDAGDLPEDVDVDELSNVVTSVLIHSITEFVNGRSDEPLEPVFRRRVGMVLMGIAASSPAWPEQTLRRRRK